MQAGPIRQAVRIHLSPSARVKPQSRPGRPAWSTPDAGEFLFEQGMLSEEPSLVKQAPLLRLWSFVQGRSSMQMQILMQTIASR